MPFQSYHPALPQNEPEFLQPAWPALPWCISILRFSHPVVWNTSASAILQWPPTQMLPLPLYALCRQMLPHFSWLTKMHKPSENGINHYSFNSVLPYLLQLKRSLPPSWPHHPWLLAFLQYVAPATLHWSHEFIDLNCPIRLHIFWGQGRNFQQLCASYLLAQSLQTIPKIFVEKSLTLYPD